VDDSNGHCEKKKVHMNMCLILNGYPVRAVWSQNTLPLDFCLWGWVER